MGFKFGFGFGFTFPKHRSLHFTQLYPVTVEVLPPPTPPFVVFDTDTVLVSRKKDASQLRSEGRRASSHVFFILFELILCIYSEVI